MIYAIGDIHGMLDKLENLYKQILMDIAFQSIKKTTIVFLGDYVDRGPQSREVLDFLMNLKDTDSIKHVFLMGNHEEMMIETYYGISDGKLHVSNGGRETLDSFECATLADFLNNTNFKKYINWCENLPTMHIINKYVFVHGGYNPNLSPENQTPVVLLWKRTHPYTKDNAYDLCDYIVVHGHTPHDEPQIFRNEINVDTFACYDGKLTAACLPNLIETYSIDEIKEMSDFQLNIIINEEIRFIQA